MISANKKSNTVRFSTSESCEILSDHPPTTPTFEGRSTPPISTPSIANASGHALLPTMDPETPPSSLPSGTTPEPSSKPTGAKAKKKNQKSQGNIQQFLTSSSTPKQGIGQKVRDGVRHVLETLPPLSNVPPPPGITPLNSIIEEDNNDMDTSETHKRSRTPPNSDDDDPHPPQRQRPLLSDSLVTQTSLNATPDDDASSTPLTPLTEIATRAAAKAKDKTFPQVTLNLATDDLTAKNIDLKIQDIIDKAKPFSSPQTPALEWDHAGEVEKPTPPSQHQHMHNASDVQQISTSTPIQQDKTQKEQTNDVLAVISASVSKNTKIALENLTNITAVLEQLTATRQDVQRHTEEITAIREDFTQKLETTANTAVEALQRQNQQHEEYKHQSQQLIANLTNRIATLEAASRHDPNEALQQRIEQLEARPQLSMETVTQITKQQKANDDTYFFSTVSIKGFSPTELQGRSQRRAVECILDALDCSSLVREADKVSATRESIRLTFKNPGQARWAISQLAGASAWVRNRGHNTTLRFSQLTPPRFGEQRKILFDKARAMKNDGTIDRFFFASIGDQLVLKAVKGDQLSIIKATDQNEAMDTDQVQQTSSALCAICQNPFASDIQTQALTCGHRFHANCLKTSLSTNLRCPICRNTPLGFDPTRIDCTRCLGFPDDERSPTANFCVSRKCRHIHTVRCQTEHVTSVEQTPGEFQFTVDGTRNIMNSTVRGCFQCHENLVPLMTAVPYVFNIPFATDMPQFEIPGLPYPVPSQRNPDQPANNRRGEEISNRSNRLERRPRSNEDRRGRPERRERSNEERRSRQERTERSYDRDRVRRQQRRQHSNNDRRR